MVFHHFFHPQNLAWKCNEYMRDMINEGKFKIVRNTVLVQLNYHNETEFCAVGTIEWPVTHERVVAFIQWFNEVTKGKIR